MAKENILVVDDEEDILELITYNLSREGYHVQPATSGEEALERVSAEPPDLIILDLMLPGIDGLEVCRELRANAKSKRVPIMMLTARGEESDIVTGLELGADDYMVKPFSPRVLIARARSLLRRRKAGAQDASSVIRVDELSIDPNRREVMLKDKTVDLTYSEFGILHLLARQRGWVFTRHQIVGAVHGDDYPVTDRSIDVQIVNLRRKLGPYGQSIETVRGVGYRFKG